MQHNHHKMALKQFFTLDIDPGPAGITSEHRYWISKVQCIMRPIFAEGYDCGKTGTSAPSTTSTLLVIFPHRRNIAQTNCNQRPNINTYFHSSCAAKNINWGFALYVTILCITASLYQILKTEFVVFCFGPVIIPLILVRKLRRMFLGINHTDLFTCQSVFYWFSPKMQRVIFPFGHCVNRLTAAPWTFFL